MRPKLLLLAVVGANLACLGSSPMRVSCKANIDDAQFCVCGQVNVRREASLPYSEGLPGVAIVVERAQEQTVFTDADGFFLAPVERPGMYRVEARLEDGTFLASHYAFADSWGVCRAAPIDLPSHSMLIVDMESQSYPLLVELYAYQGHTPVSQGSQKIEGPEIVYFMGLPPGRYALAAVTEVIDIGRVYYPAGETWSESEQIHLGAGQRIVKWRVGPESSRWSR